ncbi:hypothetical protein LTR36_000216 [Oleoguttula mirabilis]|uniref:Mitochondrial import inner membrane translocase subunit TIM50 n=1 Tax=Oleoguttula mirabilis TaxID=1507867 RepID=A0AAV9JZN0_9PEZI|nr:hypothetical protein LTR36_000216 [Oleoguttula mirabilis]
MAAQSGHQATDWLNRTYSRPSTYGQQALHHSRPSSISQQQQPQYGASSGQHGYGYGGSIGGHREAHAGYGADEPAGYESYRPARYEPARYGSYEPTDYDSHKPAGYDRYEPTGYDSYEPAGYRQGGNGSGGAGYRRGGGVYGQEERYSWPEAADRSYTCARDHRPAPAIQVQGFQQQEQVHYSYGQLQQYAHPVLWNPQYQPYQPHHQQQHHGCYSPAEPSLTQPSAVGDSTRSAFDASAPAFTPVNLPQSALQQPLKSVSTKELNRRHRINKQVRYAQHEQQAPKAKVFDPTLFNSAFLNQYTPPAESLKDVVPGWYKQTLAGKLVQSQNTSKGLKAQVPVGQTRFNPSMRTPPPSPKPASGKLKLIRRPEPTRAYLTQARQDSLTLDQPRPLLVILDLNGTLLYRKQRGGSTFVGRPRVKEFLHYLLTYHRVMVWSSARPENVGPMCDQLFTAEQRKNLVAVWGRDKLRLSKDHYNEKVQVYKQLSWIWKDHVIASSCGGPEREWSQENTVLIDDSVEKAASEPHNIIKIHEFEAKREQMEIDVLGQVVKYLETLRWERDVSAYLRWKPFVYEEDAEAYDWMPIVNDMH